MKHTHSTPSCRPCVREGEIKALLRVARRLSWIARLEAKRFIRSAYAMAWKGEAEWFRSEAKRLKASR